MSRKSISVSIIEDNKVIRENVKKYIEFQEDIVMNGSFFSIEDFERYKAKFPCYEPEIILLDIGLPGISGLDALPLIRRMLPDTNIIMLTTYDEERTILKAICSGAVGYVSKKTKLADIMEAIRVVKDGGSYMSPSIAREIVNHLVSPKNQKSTILSDRQVEILELLVNAYTYKEIADELFISPHTVKTHLKNIYKALNVNNKAAAISMYLKGEIK